MMNKQQILRKRPIGLPGADTWELVETPIPSIDEGQFLVRNKYISLDPAMRGWINANKSYIAPVELNDVMRAGGVGEIIKSKNSNFKVGDLFYALPYHICPTVAKYNRVYAQPC